MISETLCERVCSQSHFLQYAACVPCIVCGTSEIAYFPIEHAFLHAHKIFIKNTCEYLINMWFQTQPKTHLISQMFISEMIIGF